MNLPQQRWAEPPDPETCPKCGDYIDIDGKCEDETCDFEFVEPGYDDRED
jgi:hypothetical protein